MIPTVKELLILNEGLRLKPYKDTVGKLTIGVGRNLDDVGISTQEAMMMLDNDIRHAEIIARSYPFWEKLNDVRRAVIIDMIFNLGAMGFSKFEKTIKFLNESNWIAAADEMAESAWAQQVKKRALRSINMMITGRWAQELK